MFVFEWVFGWFSGVALPLTRPGVVVRTNRSTAIVKTLAYRPIVRGR